MLVELMPMLDPVTIPVTHSKQGHAVERTAAHGSAQSLQRPSGYMQSRSASVAQGHVSLPA